MNIQYDMACFAKQEPIFLVNVLVRAKHNMYFDYFHNDHFYPIHFYPIGLHNAALFATKSSGGQDHQVAGPHRQPPGNGGRPQQLSQDVL